MTETSSRVPPRFVRGWRILRQALSGREYDYTTGRLSRAILLLAIPMVLETSLESVFAIADIYFVQHLGEAAVATVGLTESVLTLVYAIAIGLSMSTTAMVARRVGEGDRAAASRAAAQSLYLGVALALALGLPCWFLAEELLVAMGAAPDVLALGAGYTRLLLSSNVVILLLFLNNAIFRGAGDAVYAMRCLWLANGLNLVLDPCLIFGWGPFPRMGLEGAALATVLGRGTGVLVQLWLLFRGGGRIRVTLEDLAPDPRVVLRILRLSLGGIGQWLIATASWLVLTRLVAPFGSVALAGYTIAIRIAMFLFIPSWGLSNAAATLVGQCLGARDPERAERSVWITTAYNMGLQLVLMLVCLCFTDSMVGWITDDPQLGEVARQALRIISLGFVSYAAGTTMAQAFNGAGDTAMPTKLNLACYWALQVPAAWLATRVLGAGPAGVYWSIVGAETVLAILGIVMFRRGGWKRTVV